MIKPSRGVLIGAGVFVVIAAVVFGFTFAAAAKTRDEPKPRPALQASVGTTLENVPPLQFCDDIRNLKCDPATKLVKITVKPGQAIVVSLPKTITSQPWVLTVQRYDPKLGKATLETTTHVKPTEATLVLKSTDEVRLAAVEIRLPSDVQDQFGNLVSRAVWGIDTYDGPSSPVPAT